jgi:hypothetical protein
MMNSFETGRILGPFDRPFKECSEGGPRPR